MRIPEVKSMESIAEFHASEISYNLIYKLNNGWVHYVEGISNNGEFDPQNPPEHLFDATYLSDSLDGIDADIKEELQQVISICEDEGCRYFKFYFDEYATDESD